MQTRLSIFCDKVIEAGWLAVAITLPMLFDIYSESVFEIDKACLLRSIALVMLLAWVIKMAESGLFQSEQGGRQDMTRRLVNFVGQPLVLPTLILAGVYILASLTSVWPHVSFWGSYRRLKGIYTALSCMVIFLLTLQTLRTQEQLERLIRLIVLTSLPVSLYAIIQHYRWDPMLWGGDITQRVTSSLGNPIFVAAYVIMVIPLTVGQLMNSLSELLASRGNPLRSPSWWSPSHLMPVAVYFFVLTTQLVGFVFTQSRGPLLALAGGLFFFLILWAICKGKKGWGLMAINLAVLLMLLLAILNLPNTPLTALKQWPYVGPLSTFMGAVSLKERVLTWEGAINMSRASLMRTILGYGPDTMMVAFYPYLSPGLVDIEGYGWTQNHPHNETLDALVTTGLLGVAAYLFLLGSLFYYGLSWLGLIVSPLQRTLFIAWSIVGGVLGVLIPWLLDGTLKFAGVGIPAGMVAALVIYLVTFLVRDQKEKGEGEAAHPSDRRNHVLLIALFSAMIAHFIEIQSGIAFTTTRTYFWLYAALMAVIALPLQREPVPVQVPARPLPVKAPSKRPPRGRRRRREEKVRERPAGRGVSRTGGPRLTSVLPQVLPHSLLIGLLLATMGFDFVSRGFNLRYGFAVVGLCLLVWLWGGVMAIAEVGTTTEGRLYFPVSLVCWLIFLPFYKASLPPSGNPANTVIIYYLCLFLIIMALAWVLLRRGLSLPDRSYRRANVWLYVILTIIIVILIFTTNLNVVRADIYFKQGQAHQSADRLDRSIELYKRALELVPNQDYYYLFLSQAYFKKAQQDTDQSVVWFEEAQRTLERARELSPLDPDHYANLGTLHHYWAEVTADPPKAAEMLREALTYYQQAVTMSPASHGNFKENMFRARLTLARTHAGMGEFDKAIEEVKVARGSAPAEEKAELDELIAQLEAQSNRSQ